jgi:hypothetical protein
MRRPLRTAPSRALGLALAVAVLACPKADEPKAPPAAAEAEAPAAPAAAPSAAPKFSAGDVRALVAPVALYPDPLLAVVLQSSTQPLQVVSADRFLRQRQTDASLAPDAAWDSAVIALLNYPELVDMLSESLDWTEALGAATLDQLGDVQGAVQEIRFSSYNLGILRSNDVQEVLVRESVIGIVPKDPNQVSIPSYDGAELLAAIDQGESMAVAAAQAAPAGAEAAPPAATAEEAAPPPAAAQAPAPTYAAAPVTPPAYAPTVAYSEPQSSFWTNAAIFTGGAVIGGLLGYAIGGDDDDDDDNHGDYYGWGGGGGRYYSDNDIKINGDVTVNRPVNVQRELNNRVQPATRPRPYAGQRPGGRVQPKPLARPAGPPGAGTRPNVKPGRAPAPSVQLPKPVGKPSGVAAQRPALPKPVARPSTGTQTARRDSSSGAFGDRPSPTRVAKESDRGARSRQSAAKPAAARAPQTASRQVQKQHKQGKAGGLSRQKTGGGGSAKAHASRGKQSRGKKR